MKFNSQVAKLPCRLMQKPIELPCSRQLAQVISQGFGILHSMPSVWVVMAIEALVSSRRIPTHLIRPFEIRLILYFLQYVVY